MRLRKPQEWIDAPKEEDVVWVHSLDLLDHVLQGDVEKSKYKGREQNGEYYLQIIRDAMADGPGEPDPEWFNQVEREWKPKKKYRTRKAKAGAKFNVKGFIERKGGDRSARCFSKYYKTDEGKKEALTIFFEMCIHGGQTHEKHMEQRHREIYNLTLQAEREGTPCRVVAFTSCKASGGRLYPKAPADMIIKYFIVVKDYNERIYPGIWGALKNNMTSNALQNCIHNYFSGVHASGNGNSQNAVNIAEYIPSNEKVEVLEGKHLSYERRDG
jgi:hypothetical protein